MKVELNMSVRGGERTVWWEDGALSGDDEVLRRLQPLITAERVEVADLVSVLRGVELVTAQRVTVVNLDLVEPQPVEPGEPGRPPGRLLERRPSAATALRPVHPLG